MVSIKNVLAAGFHTLPRWKSKLISRRFSLSHSRKSEMRYCSSMEGIEPLFGVQADSNSNPWERRCGGIILRLVGRWLVAGSRPELSYPSRAALGSHPAHNFRFCVEDAVDLGNLIDDCVHFGDVVAFDQRDDIGNAQQGIRAHDSGNFSD